MNWNNDELLAELSFPGGFLPKDALEEAQHRYDEIKIELFTALNLSPDGVKTLETTHNKEYSLKFFAMYLAAQKRDVDAFAPIYKYFAAYGEKSWECLGNMTSGDLVQVLTAVYHGDVRAMNDEVDLDGMDSFARVAFSDVLGTHSYKT